MAMPTLEDLKHRLDSRLNDHLCEMKEGYDDSIVGFNEAWDIVRKFFTDVATELAAPKLRPTIAELEAILNSEDDRKVTVAIDGSVTVSG